MRTLIYLDIEADKWEWIDYPDSIDCWYQFEYAESSEAIDETTGEVYEVKGNLLKAKRYIGEKDTAVLTGEYEYEYDDAGNISRIIYTEENAADGLYYEYNFEYLK